MPNFFISYRRADTEGSYLAHMLFRELRRRYADDTIFLDVDSRSPGLSFPDKVNDALDKTDALLVVIGPQWLEALHARIGNTRDWVRYEVSEGLKRSGLPVVPVCHVRAQLPTAEDLPVEISDLALRDGITLDPFQDFDSHLSRMLKDLDRVIERNTNTELRPPSSTNSVTNVRDLPDTPSTTTTNELVNQRQLIGGSTNARGENSASMNSSVEGNRPKSKTRPKEGSVSVRNKPRLGSEDSPQKHEQFSSAGPTNSQSQPGAAVGATSPSSSTVLPSANIDASEAVGKYQNHVRSFGTVVKFDHVSVIYRFGANESVTAINDITFSIEQGNFLAVSGPSGSGKTTLLKLIGGLERPTSGTVHIDGLDWEERRPHQGLFAKLLFSPFKDELTRLRQRNIGFVPEQLDLLLGKTVEENVGRPLLERDDIGRSERQERVVHFVNLVGLAKQSNETVGRLSKREHWRVGLARALAGSPRILLLDDPTANLDQSATGALLSLLGKINAHMGQTIVCSTRKERKVTDMANLLVQLENGEVEAFGVRHMADKVWSLAKVKK